MKKENNCYTLLGELACAIGVEHAAQAAERPLAELEGLLWHAFTTPLDRAALMAAGEALAALCAESDILTRGGRPLSPDNRRIADALTALVKSLPRLNIPGNLPGSADFRALLRAPARPADTAFRRAAAHAWQMCVCAALTGI